MFLLFPTFHLFLFFDRKCCKKTSKLYYDGLVLTFGKLETIIHSENRSKIALKLASYQKMLKNCFKLSVVIVIVVALVLNAGHDETPRSRKPKIFCFTSQLLG